MTWTAAEFSESRARWERELAEWLGLEPTETVAGSFDVRQRGQRVLVSWKSTRSTFHLKRDGLLIANSSALGEGVLFDVSIEIREEDAEDIPEQRVPDITFGARTLKMTLTAPVPNPPNPRDLGTLLTWLVENRDRNASAEVDLPTAEGFQRYHVRAKANGNIVLKPIDSIWSF